MRTIKFRVWCNKREVWLNECVFDMKIQGAYDFSSDSSMRYNYKDNVSVSQFTGMLDSQSVEIYEGDIIQDHVGTGEVKYVDSRAAFRVSYGDGIAKWFTDYILKGERESIIVIGNIYETKNEGE
jgi:hypothetical protein